MPGHQSDPGTDLAPTKRQTWKWRGQAPTLIASLVSASDRQKVEGGLGLLWIRQCHASRRTPQHPPTAAAYMAYIKLMELGTRVED
jgi:hypothetical protein